MIHARSPILTAAALLAVTLVVRPTPVQPVHSHACVEGTWHGDLLVPPKTSELMPVLVPIGHWEMPNAYVSGLSAKSLL
jgi:hypothetical protein